jgi:hypothetical protein
VFRWDVIASGFQRLAVATGDGRLLAFVREHWLHVLAGDVGWRDPPMFHPATGTLGYSDAAALDVLVYGPLRWLGLEPLVAHQATWLVLSLVGFVGFALLCRRLLHATRGAAIVAALLFTFSSALRASTPQAQLFAIYWLPWLLLAAANALAAARGSPARGAAWATLGGLAFALLFLTAYYVAWLTALAGAVFVACRVAVTRRWPRIGRAGVGNVPWGVVAGAAAGFAIGIVPFVLVYAPVLLEGHTRTFADALGATGRLTDLVNVGPHNLVWGAVLERLPGYPADRLRDPQAWRVVTPLVLLTALTGVWTLRRRPDRDTTLALFWTMLVLLVLPLRVGDLTPWWLVLHTVPGASAIRFPWRLELLNVAVATALVAIVLSTLSRARTTAGRAAFALLAVVLLAEQQSRTNWAALDLVRERAELDAASPAPPACRAFVLTDDVGVVDTPNTFAMSLAHHVGIPTVNGYSGFSPQGWAVHPDPRVPILPAADVLAAAGAWLRQRNAVEGTCRYDLPTRTWTVDPFRGWWAIEPDTTIELGTGGTGARYTSETGWGAPESFGRWVEGGEAELAFELGDGFTASDRPVLHLFVGAFLHGALAEQRVDVEVDGQPAAQWRFTPADSPRWETLPLPAPSTTGDRHVRITFRNRTAASPASTGFNADPRLLGLSLTRFRLARE